MASKTVMIAAIAIVVVVVAAAALVVVYPRLVNNKPSTVPGTSFISPGVVGSSIGGSWQKTFYVSGGTENPADLTLTYSQLLTNLTTAQLIPAYQAYPAGAGASAIGYRESGTGSTLFSLYVDYPNSTAASDAYANITSSLQLNSSIHLSSGTVSGAAYTYANVTGGVNATQLIYSHSGTYLFGFVYDGATAVSESGMVNLVKNEISVLGTTSSSYPSQLVTTAQVNSALSLSMNSYAYALANITNASSLLNTYGTSTANLTGAGMIESQSIGNITEVGFTTMGDQASNVTMGSAFVSFKIATYPSALYEDLNSIIGSNSFYSQSYHTGTVSGKQYFYFNTNVSSNSSAKISLLFCVDGNTLIVQYVISSTLYNYQQMTGLAAAQISDL